MTDQTIEPGAGWRIREFRLEDYAGVFRLWENAGAGVEIRPSDQRGEVAKKLSRDPDLFLVVEEEGRVLGVLMGAWDGRRGWLHHLAVERSRRREGIARALIDEVEKRLRARGCLKVNLLVRRENDAARRLYAELGYDEYPGIVAVGKELDTDPKKSAKD